MIYLAYPKVLVVGINPWIDNTGINTLVNFFEDWDKNAIAHLYTRAGRPNTHICDRFFRISEPKVMKSVLNRRLRTGEVVTNAQCDEKDTVQEKRIYARKHTAIMTLARELVWLLGKWKSKELDQFLDDYDADVLFFPIYSTVYMNRLQNYIKQRTNKPVVLYISDDNYSYQSISKTPISLFSRWWLRIHERKLFNSASRVMVITEKQKEEYDTMFGKNCIVMTKGIDFSNIPFEEKHVNHPIKMVYTGKLIIGRWLSLAKIAEALGQINQEQIKMELDIYTTDTVTPKQQKALNQNGCSLKGSLSLNDVQRVQKAADILVFVESLEKKYRYTARLSFSTKITDYLKNGKCIFAVGDKDIAPIDYFQRNDSAVTATTYDEIEEKLKMLAEDPSLIMAYSKKAYHCGRRNHSKERMKKILFETINGVCMKEINHT